MIQIDQLKFCYHRSEFILKIESLSIKDGEKVAIVGPSGSGKTTLLNLIAGILKPDSGTIQVGEHVVSDLSESQRRDFRIANIGMVFQQFELVEYLDVRNNVLLPFDINRSLKLDRETRKKSESLVAAMGLGDKFRRRTNQLSQGEQQRVAICRALITSPKLILADEPTGNLDPKNKQLILDLIFEQAQQRGQTLVVVTHDMGILEGFDRVVDFDQFRVEAGTSSSSDRSEAAS